MVEMLEMMLMTRMCISFHLPPSTAALSLLNIPPEYLNILPAPSPPALPNYMQFSHRIEWYICTENIWIFWPVYSDIFVQTKDRADSQLWTISSVAPLYVQCTLCTLSIFHVHSSHPEVGVIFLPHWAIIGWRGLGPEVVRRSILHHTLGLLCTLWGRHMNIYASQSNQIYHHILEYEIILEFHKNLSRFRFN